MELREIESFICVAKHKSFSRAAEKLGYTQAAITIQIRNLEKELCVHLFDRIGKRTLLTREGELFYRYAALVMQSLAEAKEALSDQNELRGRLAIGTIESICASILPPIIERYHARYPEVRIDIAIDSPDALLSRMDQNELDLVYILDKRICSGKWIKALEEPEDVVFAAGRSAACLKKKQMRLKEVLKEPFILTEKGASYRHIMDSYLAAYGLSLRPFVETGNTEFIVKLLKSSDSVSLLPMLAIREELLRGELCVLPVEDLKMRIWRQILYHKDKWVTREMKAFLELACGDGEGSEAVN